MFSTSQFAPKNHTETGKQEELLLSGEIMKVNQ